MHSTMTECNLLMGVDLCHFVCTFLSLILFNCTVFARSQV